MSVKEREINLGSLMEYIDICGRVDVLSKLLDILYPIVDKLLEKSEELPEDSELGKLIIELGTNMILVEQGTIESSMEAEELNLPSAAELIEFFQEDDSSVVITTLEEDKPKPHKEGKLVNMFDYINKKEQ